MFSGKPSGASQDVEKGEHELSDLDQNNISRFQVAKVDGDAEKDDSLNVNQLSVGFNQGSYDSRHKSIGQLTREVPPRAEHYRDLTTSAPPVYRPTLEELHENFEHKLPESKVNDGQQQQQKKGKIIRFGWLEGVFMRCLLNIWGVMLFLRLSWVIGQAGIGEGAAIIILANVVTLVTSISMSAVCTNGLIKGVVGILVICLANLVTLITAISMSTVGSNGEIKAGGIYYMISRSLGPEFGGAIGLMFTLANSIAVSMYIVGFCESLQDLLRTYGITLIDGASNDIRVVGLVTLIAILVLAIVGMDWVTRTQMVLLVVLILSQIDFVIGSVLGPQSENEISKGFIGYNKETFMTNMRSDYRLYEGVEHNFFSVFAVFFPAVTGIVAGANLSGDLKDPSSAIPVGTLLAIVVTFVSYILYGFMMGGCVLREASGIASEYVAALNDSDPFSIFTNCTERACRYGLHNDNQAMELVSWWGPLIYGGCFAATLSSAIASLVGAPRVLQALAKDKLYPFIGFFSVGFGANNDPVRGYVLVFGISFGCILIAQLNAIAPLLSNFFLAAYALINFSVFHASISRSPGWRPAFKYYNAWISLIGTLLCIAVMFLMSWWTALITFVVVITLYLYVSYRKPEVNWGSSTQAQAYSSALKAMQELNRVEEHVKNYRPQILVLSGMPGTRPTLMHFSNLITKGLSLNICGYAIKGNHSQRVSDALTKKAYSWLRRHRIKSFFNVAEDENFETAVEALIKISGLGKLKPNMLLMGYKSNWQTCDREELLQYFDIIHYALDKYLAVGILRIQGGLDYSGIINDDEFVPISFLDKKDAEEKMRRNQSAGQLSQVDCVSSDTDTPPTTPRMDRVNISTDPSAGDQSNATNNKEKKKKNKKKNKEKNPEVLYTGPGGDALSKDILNKVTLFQTKQRKGFIDVWWLYDDGGLTLLIPYILSTRSIYANCKLRIFSLSTNKNDLDSDQRNLAALLSKFRIEYSDVVVIPDISRKAGEGTKKEFETLIENFRSNNDNDDTNECQRTCITDAELCALKEKTNRHLRLRELLLQYSKDSTFIVMALPIPRKGIVSAPLYLAWLELLTKGMPPYLLVRGNQTSVLTYYS